MGHSQCNPALSLPQGPHVDRLTRIVAGGTVLDLFKLIASWLVPLFVVTSMLNVGLTQKPSRILHHLRNYRFLVRMVATT